MPLMNSVRSLVPIFGGAEDVDKLDETVSGDAPLDGVQFGDEPIFGGDAPITEGDGLQGDGGLVDPFGGGDDNLVDPNDGLGDGIVDPNNPGDGILDPNSLPQELGGDDVEPNGLVGDGPEETVEGNPTVDEAANVEFNENLHLQGDAPDSGLTAEEMEEHRLNILRQLRG